MARWLGIDVSSTMVRVALLSSSVRKTVLVALREERIADHETPSAAIRSATTALRADACAAALDGKKGFMRRLDVPRAAQKDLQNVLSYEVEATLPFEMEDAVMDHRRLKPIAGVDGDDIMAIFAGVANTEEVRDVIGLTKRGFGVEPTRVGIGPLPLCNLAQVTRELAVAEPVAVVELAEESCDVLIVRGGEPRFARSLSRGIRGLPESAPALVRDLKQTFAAWRSGGGQLLSRAIVVGAGRAVSGLEGVFASELGVTVVDLPKLAIDEVTPEQEAMLPRFAKAIGLALSLSRRSSDLNLRQGPLAAQESFAFLREKTPLLSGLAAAIAVSFGFSVFAEMRALNVERKSLEEQLSVVTKAHFGKPTNDPKEAADLLQAAIDGKSDDPLPAMDAFDVMVALSDRVPRDMIHDVADFDFKKNAVTLKGMVSSGEDAEKLQKNVAEHECFKEVNLSHTTKLKEKNRYKYTLEFKIDCSKAKGDKKSAAAAPTGTQGGGR
jgi:general secretion pathway protein L